MWIMSDIGHHAALHSATGHVEHRVARFVVGVAGGWVVQIRMAMNHPPVTIFVGGIRLCHYPGGKHDIVSRSNINNVYMVGLCWFIIIVYYALPHMFTLLFTKLWWIIIIFICGL
jgi:hypothetical protein